jgi:glucose/arabinose dehydrogenase
VTKASIIILIIVLVLGGAALTREALDFTRGVRPVISPPFVPTQTETPPIVSSPLNPNPGNLSLNLPPGFAIQIFAKNLGNPRVLSLDPFGNLLAAITGEGKVVALRDEDGDGRSDETITVISGLNRPHGLAWRCEAACQLYIAETDKVLVYDYTPELKAINGRKIVDLPGGGGHFTRTLLFRAYPDEDELLISVGSSCNVCRENDSRRATILSYNIKTAVLTTYATGLRNAVFMNLHPVTGEVWVTEMGRDHLGDDLPPDEINIVQKGKNYGWPICYGKNIHDGDFDKNVYIRNPCQEPFETPSHIDIPAHSAPLGLTFIPEEGFSEDHWYDLIVAYHGSWNRSTPTGYKLVRFKLDEKGNFGGVEDFITGWLAGGAAWGRPADVLILSGGAMYVSDDKAGLIYKISRF